MGKLTDEADQRLLLAQAKAVAAAMAEMLRLTESATSALPDATKKGVVGKVRGGGWMVLASSLTSCAYRLCAATSWLVKCVVVIVVVVLVIAWRC